MFNVFVNSTGNHHYPFFCHCLFLFWSPPLFHFVQNCAMVVVLLVLKLHYLISLERNPVDLIILNENWHTKNAISYHLIERQPFNSRQWFFLLIFPLTLVFIGNLNTTSIWIISSWSWKKKSNTHIDVIFIFWTSFTHTHTHSTANARIQKEKRTIIIINGL